MLDPSKSANSAPLLTTRRTRSRPPRVWSSLGHTRPKSGIASRSGKLATHLGNLGPTGTISTAVGPNGASLAGIGPKLDLDQIPLDFGRCVAASASPGHHAWASCGGGAIVSSERRFTDLAQALSYRPCGVSCARRRGCRPSTWVQEPRSVALSPARGSPWRSPRRRRRKGACPRLRAPLAGPASRCRSGSICLLCASARAGRRCGAPGRLREPGRPPHQARPRSFVFLATLPRQRS